MSEILDANTAKVIDEIKKNEKTIIEQSLSVDNMLATLKRQSELGQLYQFLVSVKRDLKPKEASKIITMGKA